MANKHLQFSYEPIGDVLYVSAVRGKLTKNIEDVAGLVLRYDLATNAPVGATVIDFKEYWSDHRNDLAMKLADFLHVSTRVVREGLESIRDRKTAG